MSMRPVRPSLVLRLGSVERVLDVDAIATALGIDVASLETRLLACAKIDPNDARTIDRNDGRVDTYPQSIDGGDRGPREEAAVPEPPESVEALASYLAERLADPMGLAWYERVARGVPHDIVSRALAAALDLPPSAVRRSRAAYFTAIVRPHLRAGHGPHSHARTSSRPS